MTDRERDAVILVYTNACVELTKKFRKSEDYTMEMALCNALEDSYPDVIADLREKDERDLKTA